MKDIVCKFIPYSELINSHKRINKEKEELIIHRLKRTWQISTVQYKELFGEEPYFSPKLKYYKIIEISDSLRIKFDNFDNFRKSIYMYYININTRRPYHNYTNIDNIIEFKKNNNINLLNIHFDDENFIKYDESYKNSLIRADWVVIKDNYYYFIETDLWTENYNILRDKSEKYYKLINLLKDNDPLFNYKLIFFTTYSRIFNLKKEKVFEKLDNMDLIEYYPNLVSKII